MFGSVEAQARVLVTTVRATNYRGSTFLEGRLQRAAVPNHEVQSWREGVGQARLALHRWERSAANLRSGQVVASLEVAALSRPGR
jgi:hypothetical protein